MLLSWVYPLNEKSGVNLRGNFNVGKGFSFSDGKAEEEGKDATAQGRIEVDDAKSGQESQKTEVEEGEEAEESKESGTSGTSLRCYLFPAKAQAYETIKFTTLLAFWVGNSRLGSVLRHFLVPPTLLHQPAFALPTSRSLNLDNDNAFLLVARRRPSHPARVPYRHEEGERPHRFVNRIGDEGKECSLGRSGQNGRGTRPYCARGRRRRGRRRRQNGLVGTSARGVLFPKVLDQSRLARTRGEPRLLLTHSANSNKLSRIESVIDTSPRARERKRKRKRSSQTRVSAGRSSSRSSSCSSTSSASHRANASGPKNSPSPTCRRTRRTSSRARSRLGCASCAVGRWTNWMRWREEGGSGRRCSSCCSGIRIG